METRKIQVLSCFILLTTLLFSNITFPNFKTDTSKHSIDMTKIFHGGPEKDGIPAIYQPKFISIKEAKLKNDAMGSLVKINGIQKFYPLNILAWHEIVNDSIKDTYFSVTYCPLCGSSIVFNRKIGKEIVKFGVTGYLYESNLLMYDDKTESFWSQSLGKAIVGSYTGRKLHYLASQMIDFKTLKKKYNKVLILSENTGHTRNYSYFPYGDYNADENIYFPTSVEDKRFHAKRMMYVFEINNKSYVFPIDAGKEEFITKKDGKNIKIIKKNSEIKVYVDKKLIPGYFEMWFSWAIHHGNTGTVIDFEKK